ncbi:restriction endonuclease subunit S [Brenneria izadpanahii]|nr:restriction endonuclease subunit S [Brenneria izadpanahii]
MSTLPIGWARVDFDESVDVVSDRGFRIKQKDYLTSGKLPVIDQGEGFIGGYTNDLDAQVISPSPLIVFGDHTRRFKLVTFPFAVGADGVKLFSPIPVWEPKFLFLQLQNLSIENRGYGRHFQHLRKKSLFLAPFPEQIRIVEKLEELLTGLDSGMAELKVAQKKLSQYRQSLLKAAVEGALTAEWRENNPPIESGSQLLERILLERRARWEAKQLAKFTEQGKKPPKDWQNKYPEPVQPDTTDLPQLPEGWVWASVEQIASDEQYSLAIGPFGSNLKVSDYRASGVPLVFVRNIRSGNYGGENTRFVSQIKANELSAHGVMPGDVVVTKMGEPPGDADVYPDDQPPAIITADCIKIRCCGELMNPLFLKIAINSNVGKRQIEPMTKGVAQKKVSLGRFSKLAVPVPPANEQSLIVRMVGEADNDAFVQLAAIDLSLKQCSAQRQNILRAAFSGQLVTQEPNDEPASVLLERIRAQRAEQAKQPKPRMTKKKESTTVARKLIDVLTEASDWLPAQEAFRRCGIADGAQTEEIEALYAELRTLDKSQHLSFKAVFDLVDTPEGKKHRKVADHLKWVG